jgi:hypothetical protein
MKLQRLLLIAFMALVSVGSPEAREIADDHGHGGFTAIKPGPIVYKGLREAEYNDNITIVLTPKIIIQSPPPYTAWSAIYTCLENCPKNHRMPSSRTWYSEQSCEENARLIAQGMYAMDGSKYGFECKPVDFEPPNLKNKCNIQNKTSGVERLRRLVFC